MAAQTPQIASVWTRPHRQRREQPALSREQIIAEAIALLDAEGFEALSMRKLGARLDAGATSLYTHVTNKDELLELVVDEVMREVRLPGDPTTVEWRATMLELSHSFRATMLTHPWLAVVMSSTGLTYLGPNMMRLGESLLTVLELAGFDDSAADHALNVVIGYLIGSTSTEAAMLNTAARSGVEQREWFERLLAAGEVAARPYPRMHRRQTVSQETLSDRSREEDFTRELGLILDGLGLGQNTGQKP